MMNEAEAINELRDAKLKAERGGRRHLPLAIRDARQAGMNDAQIAAELDMSVDLVAATAPVEKRLRAPDGGLKVRPLRLRDTAQAMSREPTTRDLVELVRGLVSALDRCD